MESINRNALLAVGAFRSEAGRGIAEAAADVGATIRFVDGDGIAAALEDDPLALLLQMDEPAAARTCRDIRTQPGAAGVPILGTLARSGDLAFTELFCWGGDDLIETGCRHALVRRLRAVITGRSAGKAPAVDRGIAVVAASDPHWRSVMGRTLHGGGYAVRFAATGDELATLAPDVKVVVAAHDLPPDGASVAAEQSRARGLDQAWVIVAPPKRMGLVYAAVRSLPRVAAVDSFAPPENVLFTLNELLAARGVDHRSTARLLYGTAVAFRPAGRDDDEVGFSYNISAEGLYVRTLAPPEPGQQVWLDAWPPRSERRVRLAGTVAWRRLFGDATKTAVPPGFGVKLADGLAGDLDRWRAGYRALARTFMGTLT